MSNKIIRGIDLLLHGKLIKKIKSKRLAKWRRSVVESTEVDPYKVFFLTFQGKYTCNPKAIADEFISRDAGYKLIWAIRRENESETEFYPKELILGVRHSKELYEHLATSKFIIQNANDTAYLKLIKRPEQVVIQTWHGSLGFKRLDVKNVGTEKWLRRALKAYNDTDYIISNSTFENEVYRTSFWPDTTILEYGHPRNDILFDQKKSKLAKDKVFEQLKIPPNKKVALYAPTFRLDTENTSVYNLDYGMLLNALTQRFGGEWMLIVRYHFKMRNKDRASATKNVVDATSYYDMQELLCAADIGITDYSSWICDYALTKKPGFLFADDIEDYVDERGFYYPLSETPFPLCKTTADLVDSIHRFDDSRYQEALSAFLEKRGCFEDGNASKRIVDKIMEINAERS